MKRNGTLLGLLLSVAIALGLIFSPPTQATNNTVGTPRPTATNIGPISPIQTPAPGKQVWRSVWLPLVTR